MPTILQEETNPKGRSLFFNIGSSFWVVSYIEDRSAHLAHAKYDAATNQYVRSFGGVRVLPGNPSLELLESFIRYEATEYQRGLADGRRNFKTKVRELFADDDS